MRTGTFTKKYKFTSITVLPMMEEAVLIVAFAFAALFAAVVTGLAYAASSRLLKPPRKVGHWTPGDLGFSFERVEVRTSDGVVLRGWLVKGASGKTVVALHGYTSSKWDESYMKQVLEMLARNGFNVAVFDMRAHGESTGEITTLGYRESEDVMKIIDFLEERGLADRLGLIGYSMGGAIALMVSSLDPRVKAVVADSPYMDIRSSGRRWVSRVKGIMGVLLRVSYPLIIWFTSRRSGVNPSKLVMREYAGKLKTPLLLIAGEKDDLVSLDEIKEFYEEVKKHNDKAELWVTGSRHVAAILDHPKEYEEKVVGFFNRWL